MVMRWFTRAWHDGELSDGDFGVALDGYQRHLADLVPSLPSDVAVLAGLYLHDAQVQSWALEDGKFAWRLLIGDLQRGYQMAHIEYHEAELLGVDRTGLESMQLDRTAADLLSDEIDRGPDGRFEHRLFFWPDHEFGVRFARVELTTSEASGAARR